MNIDKVDVLFSVQKETLERFKDLGEIFFSKFHPFQWTEF